MKSWIFVAMLIASQSVSNAGAEESAPQAEAKAEASTAGAPAAAGTALENGITWNGGVHAGIGNMANGTGSLASRTMLNYSLYAMPAWRWRQFLAGPVLEWRFVNQTTDPVNVRSTNLRGHGYMLGLAVGYQWSKYYALVGWNFFGKHVLAKNTAGGVESRYNKPLGVRAGFGYFFREHFSADALVTIDSYRQNLFGAQNVDISDSKFTHRNYALGLSAHY